MKQRTGWNLEIGLDPFGRDAFGYDDDLLLNEVPEQNLRGHF